MEHYYVFYCIYSSSFRKQIHYFLQFEPRHYYHDLFSYAKVIFFFCQDFERNCLLQLLFCCILVVLEEDYFFCSQEFVFNFWLMAIQCLMNQDVKYLLHSHHLTLMIYFDSLIVSLRKHLNCIFYFYLYFYYIDWLGL